jgi:hypothetical protein
LLGRYLNGKSIAVVGNGPQLVGLGKGKEIDSHDIVIRFNNVNLSKEFAEDYGIKFNIWAKNNGIPYSYSLLKFCDILILPDGHDRFNMDKEQIKSLYSDLIKYNKYIVMPKMIFIKSLFHNLDFCKLTTGVICSAYIKNINTSFSIDDIYAFTSVYELNNPTNNNFFCNDKLHYGYNNVNKYGFMNHSLDRDKDALRLIFNKND